MTAGVQPEAAATCAFETETSCLEPVKRRGVRLELDEDPLPGLSHREEGRPVKVSFFPASLQSTGLRARLPTVHPRRPSLLMVRSVVPNLGQLRLTISKCRSGASAGKPFESGGADRSRKIERCQSLVRVESVSISPYDESHEAL